MRQIYMGSGHQVEVGSFTTQGALDSGHTGNVLGFRLVHDASSRVSRGGSWGLSAGSARAAYRYWLNPGYRGGNLGFRLVWDRP